MNDSQVESPHNNSEICRVCRSEGTPDQPLFYPCLCSGSIKYIHQDCLIEWLKHSKKKVCELCSHPFTFSPVYVDQMPHKIPFQVLLWGLIKKLIFGLKSFFSLSFAGFLWLLVVPILTSQIFRYYFGWSLQSLLNFSSIEIVDNLKIYEHEHLLESSVMIAFDIVQGFLLTGFSVILILGMMLLREFVSILTREQQQQQPTTTTTTTTTSNRRNRNRNLNSIELSESEISVTGSGITEIPYSNESLISPISPLSPTSPRIQPLSPLRRHSELHHRASPLSPISSTVLPTNSPSSVTSNNFWLDQVHPKEYRNYLRRREFHRERIEKAEQAWTATGTGTGELNFNEEDSMLMANDDHSSNISSTTTLRSRFTNNTMASSTSRSSSLESSRCRVCSSTTCISRDHVVQATQIRNSITLQRNQSLIQRLNQNGSDLSASASASTSTSSNVNVAANNEIQDDDNNNAHDNTQNHTLNNTQNQVNPNNENNLFGWNFDTAESFSLSEFFGYTLQGTPILELLQNASIVIGFNTLLMHMFLFVPFITGKAVSNGAILRVGGTLVEALAMLIVKTEFIANLKISLKSLLNYFFTSHSELQKYTSLFTFSPDSFPAFLLNVLLGYAVLCLIISIYLRFTRDFRDAFHRVFVPIADFMGVFVKLVSLLFTEMVLFPIACGFLLDFACLGLFGGNLNFHARLEGLKNHPISSISIHWALGAFFMISFASFVTFLRTFLRPGLFFFLRNPSDPDNHPIKDIVERGFFDQIYRLSISFIFYSVLLFSSVGLFVKILKFPQISNLIFPLNFNFNDPLIEIPIDILLHILFRSLVKLLFPSKIFKDFVVTSSRKVFKALSLSSYFLGGRYLAEESFPRHGNWVAVPDYDRIYTRSRISEIRSKVVTLIDISNLKIHSDRQGLPVFDTSSSSNSNSHNRRSSSSRSSLNDWTVVYRPNYFALKCFLVILFVVFFVQGFLITFLLVPIFIGRLFSSKVQSFLSLDPSVVHELYTWTIGAIFFLAFLKVLEYFLYPKEKSSTRHRSSNNQYLNFVDKLKNILNLSSRIITICSFSLIIWPLLAGVLFSLLINPIFYPSNFDLNLLINSQAQERNNNNLQALSDQVGSVIILFFIACWSLGFPVLRAIYSLRSHLPLPQFTLNYFQRLNTTTTTTTTTTTRRLLSLTNPEFSSTIFLKFAALPITLMLILALIIPPLLCLLIIPLIQNSTYSQVLQAQRHSHLIALIIFILIRLVQSIFKFYQNILNGIRDETYLIGRRLHNLESRATSTSSNDTSASNNRSELISPL